MERFPIAQNANSIESILIALAPKHIRESGFVAQVYARATIEGNVSIESVTVPFAATYQGASLENPEHSLVSVYVTDTFVSGFFITDSKNTAAPWYFIEPLRSLLQSQQVVQANPALQDIVSTCFSPSSHIVYDATKTESRIDLGATPGSGQELAPQLSGERSGEVEPPHIVTQRNQGDPSNVELATKTALPTVPVVAVADAAFYELYGNIVEDKTWWQAQEEVLNLVNEFYHQQLGVTLEVHTLEAWSQGGPGLVLADFDGNGEPEVDVATMICHFAQGYPGSPVIHSHAKGNGTPTIAHLFTGQVLNAMPVNDVETASDAGCCFCTSNCSEEAASFVGAAEGIGGLWNQFADNCFQGVAPNPGAHHSVSQHAPKGVGTSAAALLESLGPAGEIISDAGCCLCTHNCSEEPTKSNYQGLLYQRFLLVAHEIGHNLGAQHDSEGIGIMSSSLFENTRFELSDQSREAMLQLLAR